ncbi:hypothetical protein NHX12_001021 [Muraenolepis orangiensis]|uniref:Uncharacterized protein n=1 Tax=Muraenolepis orangiensis TaxID=630683 RepID=A0A9Q0E1N5_9TELE|nr:hypothetical protein NHX12_001021 [Muraenolepis orangiensis]
MSRLGNFSVSPVVDTAGSRAVEPAFRSETKGIHRDTSDPAWHWGPGASGAFPPSHIVRYKTRAVMRYCGDTAVS